MSSTTDSQITKPTTELNKHQQLEPPMSSSSFAENILRLVTGRNPSSKSTRGSSNGNNNNNNNEQDTSNISKTMTINELDKKLENTNSSPQASTEPSNLSEKAQSQSFLSQQQQPAPSTQQGFWPKPSRTCRAPLSRRFAHPCACGQSNSHHKVLSTTNYTGNLPPAAYTSPLHLYDPQTKKCLPTSRNRDMLLKECHSHLNSYPPKPHQALPCVYDDLFCDGRRNRCACKPSLHLYYESNLSSFGCVPLGPTGSPDGRVNCRSGYVYNVISKECQKVFDINELPPTYTAGVSATQFSFVTIVLIWILLLILIVTAKLRKLRTSNLYRNSPTTERRLHSSSTSYRHQGQNTSAWLHPFIAAVNGHHHLNHHRTTVDRQSRGLGLDESGNYNDTDFFLSNGNLAVSGLLNDNNFTSSQLSLNNPPPKFEEIYPSCQTEEQHNHQQQQQQNQHHHNQNVRLPSNEDLPSYDEAMKLQNTMPPDPSKD